MKLMLAAVMVCFAVAAHADEPVDVVRAKPLFGTDAADLAGVVEPWIAKAMADAGSPVAGAYTEWQPLGAKEKSLYSSMLGGRGISAAATSKDGKFEVVVNGRQIKPESQTIVLRPGERRVLKLTDHAPNNVFLALEAPMTEQTRDRLEVFKRNVKSFRLNFNFNGDEDKPFYRPHFGVPAEDAKIDDPFRPFVQISEEQALKIIDQLAHDGTFDNAYDLRDKARREPPTTPGYTMNVWCDALPLCEDIGWGKELLVRLDAMNSQLDGDAKKSMEFMLGRISFLRRD